MSARHPRTLRPTSSSPAYLANQAVEVSVGGTLDVQVPAADVVDRLVVHHEGTIRVLQGGVGGQDGVVRFYHRCGDLWEQNPQVVTVKAERP